MPFRAWVRFIACSFLFIIVKGIIQIIIFWDEIIACSFLFIIVKEIIGIKIFLVQIYCLFLFGFDSKKFEKMTDLVYKHF